VKVCCNIKKKVSQEIEDKNIVFLLLFFPFFNMSIN